MDIMKISTNGVNMHHIVEDVVISLGRAFNKALFKALGRALDTATRLDPRLAGRVPGTKEVIKGGG